MGSIVDEETGEEPACIYCGSREECPHLVAVIDRTFAECSGGALFSSIDKLKGILSDYIRVTLSDERVLAAVSDSELRSIIREAKDNYDSDYPEHVYIDDQMFLSWLIDAMLNAGADEPLGSIVEEGGPGQTSAMSLLYATAPEVVIVSVEESLRRKFSEAQSCVADTKTELFSIDCRDKSSHSRVGQHLPHSKEALPRQKQTPPLRDRVKKRAVLVIVTDWPGGTMALNFGYALQAALEVSKDHMKLVQMGPERIFRVETSVSETEFRESMDSRGIASGGRVLYIEMY